MRFIRKLLILIASLLFSVFLFSCNVDLQFSLKKDGSVDITFNGGAGKAFSKMILSATGESADSIYDTKEIGYELAKAGFSNVKVVKGKTGTDLVITMTDLKQSSYLFTSGIVREEKGELKTHITPKSLKDFYASADEQTQMVLDLFLAPVFNDEQMSVAEYLEMLGTIYGTDAAREVDESVINVTSVALDGTKSQKRISFGGLMCGVE